MSLFEGLTIEFKRDGRKATGVILQSQIIANRGISLIFAVLGEYDWIEMIYNDTSDIKFKKEDLDRLRRTSPKYEKIIDRFELMDMEE